MVAFTLTLGTLPTAQLVTTHCHVFPLHESPRLKYGDTVVPQLPVSVYLSAIDAHLNFVKRCFCHCLNLSRLEDLLGGNSVLPVWTLAIGVVPEPVGLRVLTFFTVTLSDCSIASAPLIDFQEFDL